jgi:ACS family hexuronate transporter-like MFS transporter
MKIRWIVLSLLFVATTILYVDRAALGILAPWLQNEIGWNEEQYGIINSSFMIAYAICFLVMGPVVDRIGTKRGYLVSIAIWSVAAVSQAFAGTWIGFAIARFALATGQSGNFPSAIKVVAEWFPRKERALAIGIFNGGSNMGTIVAPLVIPAIVLSFNNWKAGFIWTFPVSISWMVIWMVWFRSPAYHPRLSHKELKYINSDSQDENQIEKISWTDILKHRGAWAIAIGKFMADPIWWFYLFWGAKFLNQKYGINLRDIGLPFFTIYLISWAIGIFLGWLSSKLLKLGFGLNRGRKLGLLACGLFAVPVILVPYTERLWPAVALIALAAGGHCGWSANIFSLMSDIFPRKATGTVAGFGGFSGAIGGALIAYVVGKILQNTGPGGYTIPFAIAGSGYLTALLIIHLIVPKIKPVKI